jgi:FKBP-type peptidyl-prolyl cis-trans isomerase
MRCDNGCMRKTSIIVGNFIVAGLMAAGVSSAQDTPPAKTTPSSSTSSQGAQGATPKTPATPAKPRTGTGATAKTAAPLVLNTQKAKVSYSIGANIGNSLHKDGVDVDPAIFLRGLKDAIAAGKLAMTDDEMRKTMMELQATLRKKQEEQMAAVGEANKKAGDAFLAENKTKDGVVTLPDGLQYKILKEGTGPKPTTANKVECNYRGTLIDGKEFDSSYKRGQPATFPVTGVIKGWTEALPLMPVGSKWQLFIPSDLAYGNRGAGPDIGPNATLVFEVELLSIKPAEAKEPAALETPKQ